MRNLKTILICLFFISNFSNAQTTFQNYYSGNLTQTELINLKFYLKKYADTDLDSISMLSVHYIQPLKYCHYSKYTNDSKASNIWFAKYYKENAIIFPEQSKIISSFYEESGKKKFSKKDDFFYDENHFLHNLIGKINKMETCECFVSINSDGKTMIKYGEVRPEEIKYFIKEIAISK